MIESGALTVAPIRDYIAATSVGIVDGEVMLDLSYEEDSRADVDMNLVITGSKKIVEVQATAERRPFDDAQLAKMMAVARKGIESLVARQQAVLAGLPLQAVMRRDALPGNIRLEGRSSHLALGRD